MLNSIISFFSSVWPYILALICFLFLIVIHEFGHFIAAKILGVKVNEFSVGFGPKILNKKGKETEYSLRLVPLGGFCAMEGEQEQSADGRAFCNKSPLKRFIIVAMGAIFNLIFGIILIAIVLSPEQKYASTKVAEFSADATSNSAGGLMEDDVIVEVEGRKIYTWYDLAYNFSAVKDGKLDMKVKRQGETVKLNDVSFRTETQQGYNVISLDFKVYAIKKSFKSFISQTAKTSVSYSRIVLFSLVDLIGGRYRVSDISGPVGVTAAIGEAAKVSLMGMFSILSLISINLGIFNLLPIPALDGGRLFFILIEMIFRKPISPKRENLVHAIGMVILLLFMGLVTFKDIWVRIF